VFVLKTTEKPEQRVPQIAAALKTLRAFTGNSRIVVSVVGGDGTQIEAKRACRRVLGPGEAPDFIDAEKAGTAGDISYAVGARTGQSIVERLAKCRLVKLPTLVSTLTLSDGTTAIHDTSHSINAGSPLPKRKH